MNWDSFVWMKRNMAVPTFRHKSIFLLVIYSKVCRVDKHWKIRNFVVHTHVRFIWPISASFSIVWLFIRITGRAQSKNALLFSFQYMWANPNWTFVIDYIFFRTCCFSLTNAFFLNTFGNSIVCSRTRRNNFSNKVVCICVFLPSRY